MQHKRRKPKLRYVLGALGVLLFGGLIMLMMTDIPPSPQPVEQVLDAKAFLNPGQQ